MADFASSQAQLAYGLSSDLNPDAINRQETVKRELTPDGKLVLDVTAATGGTTVELGTFVGILEIFVQNLGTEDVSAAYTSNGNANVQRLPGASASPRYGHLLVSDADPAQDLVLTSLGSNSVRCKVIVLGTFS